MRKVRFPRLCLMTASSSIYLFYFSFDADCVFRHQFCLKISQSPVTRIVLPIVRLVRIEFSWVYLYGNWIILINQFSVKFDQTTSIYWLSEISRTISIDKFSELARSISICDSCWLSTSGELFWIMLRFKITLPLSISFPFI